MQLLRQLLARIRGWRAARRPSTITAVDLLPLVTLAPVIHREVSSSGVRFFSMCGSCGAHLEASATLCEECAQRRGAGTAHVRDARRQSPPQSGGI